MNMEKITAILKASIVPVGIGFLAYKFGKGNLMKAAGAGVVGVHAVNAILSVTSL
jgi:hypothetical protein